MPTALGFNEAAPPLRAACAVLVRTIATLSARLARRERQLTAAKANRVAVETELDALGEVLADKEHTIAILTARGAGLERELTGAKASIVGAETKLAELADKDRIIGILTAHVADLERELAAAQARIRTTVLNELQVLDNLKNILEGSSVPPPRGTPAKHAASAERTEEIPAIVDHSTTTEQALDQQRQEQEAGGRASAVPTGVTDTDADTSFGAPRMDLNPAPCGRFHGVSPVRARRGSAGMRRPREASPSPSQESSCCE
jgi:DNA repair exonuclease SbcCD ATPase subunit